MGYLGRVATLPIILAGALLIGGVQSDRMGVPAAASQTAYLYRSFVPLAANDGPLPPEDPNPRTIGYSVQGRPINAHTIGHGQTTLVVIGGLNTGAENETADLADALRLYYEARVSALPSNVRLVFIPLVNPDGYVAGTRGNINGVDLNRNWPADNWQPEAVIGETPISGGSAPLSEPETYALYDYLLELRPDLIVTFHGYAALVEANEQPIAAQLGEAYAVAAGYEYIEKWTAYPITGELIVAMDEDGIAAFDVELEYGATSFAVNQPALDVVIAALSAGS